MSKEKKKQQAYDFGSTDLLVYMWEKRIPLVLVTFVAAVASIIVSFTITPKFKSTVVMFPTTSTSISKNLLSNNYSGRTSVYDIGDEDQAERMMQILNSEQISNKIIDKYDLMDHYGIDSASKFPMTQLNAEYSANISFKQTPYLSIVLEVLDKDPQTAADIANDIAGMVDTVYNNMLKQRALDAFQLVEKEYNENLSKVEILKDSLDQIRAKGINNYETQSERYYEALGKAIIEGNTEGQKILEEKLKILTKYGGDYLLLRDLLWAETSRLGQMKRSYQEAKLEAEQTLPHKFIVDSAYKAEKKAYPKKSIIVIISTISAFLMTLIILIIIDNLRSKIKS
jgi:tyrosine-protein kinase Etk/Wzc